MNWVQNIFLFFLKMQVNHSATFKLFKKFREKIQIF